MDIGTALGRELGLDDETINAVADWRATTALSDLEKLVIEYAERLTMTPTTVDDALRARMRDEFSPKQLAELTHFIAVENLRARFNRGFDIQPEGYSDPSD